MSDPILEELIDSPEWTSGSQPTATRHYTLSGTSDASAMRVFVLANTPTTWVLNQVNGVTLAIPRGRVRVTPTFVDTVQDVGRYDVSVEYANKGRTQRYDAATVAEPAQQTAPLRSFTTTGATAHITQAIRTRGKYVASGTAKEFKGAIGVDDNGPQGCDIVAPSFRYDLNKTFTEDQMTHDYQALLADFTGKINETAFDGWAAGEVRFDGAQGTQRYGEGGQLFWDLKFSFTVQRHATNLLVAGITVPVKQGWDYAWVLYSKVEDDAAKATVSQPTQVNVEVVLESRNFDQLNCLT